MTNSLRATAQGVDALVREGTARLSAAGVASPRVDTEILLAHACGLERKAIVTAAIMGSSVGQILGQRAEGCGAGEADPIAALARFDTLIERRAAREPLQHLTGRAPFRHLELAVGPGVFVPRPETEEVAQVAIDAARAAQRVAEEYDDGSGRSAGSAGSDGSVGAAGADASGGSRGAIGRGPSSAPIVVDLCTGSGAIALALATEVPAASVYAVELDADAHAWAQRNIAEVAGPERGTPLVDLRRGDARLALGELDGRCDVVVSNPPYVPSGAVPRDEEVALHDPSIALFGLGADGLEVPRGIVAAAARLLRAGGTFVMEHAEVQDADVRAIVAATGAFTEISTRADLTGRPRMVVARRAVEPNAPSSAVVGDSST